MAIYSMGLMSGDKRSTCTLVPRARRKTLVCTRRMPHAHEAAAISLVRFLLLIKCSGPKHAQHVLTNSLLRDLLLVPATVSVEVLRDWQACVTATHLKNFLRALIDWQQLQGRVTYRRHILACTTFSAAPVVVLIDEARALWLVAQS